MKKRFTITLDALIAKRAKIKTVKNDTNFSALIEELLREWLTQKMIDAYYCQSLKST